MIDGKADVHKVNIRPDGNLCAVTAGREDSELFIAVMRSLCPPGTRFEIENDTVVVGYMPRRSR
jgi:hypothetical protein